MTAVTQDLLFTPALTLRDAIAAGELSPVELVDAYLARIEDLQPRLNAFTLVLADQARAAARESEDRVLRREARTLEGLPIPIKDNVMVEGQPLTLASAMGIGVGMPADQSLVARLRAAGAIFPGRTNMPEFGTVARSESRRYGIARNPWDPDRTPGGSSGGAAAAVASGMAPAAHGNDGGGSLRIPAACCGVFAMKPSRGRVSRAPLVDVTHLVSEGFLTRTVADNAALMDVISGYEPGEWYRVEPPSRPFLEEVAAAPGRLRVGWTTTPPIDVPVDPVCAGAVADAARLLESLGHDVDEFAPDWRQPDLLSLFMSIWAPAIALGMDTLAQFGSDPRTAEPHNVALWEAAHKLSSSEYLLAMSQLAEVSRRIQGAWDTYDVILTPVVAQLPPPVGTVLDNPDDVDPLGPLHRDEEFVPFAAMFNITGQPAASIPVGWHQGLPLSVQAVGRLGDEATLYRLSAQIEAARPWADRRPPI